MTFVNAIKHAAIDYGIRRAAWAENDKCVLFLGTGSDSAKLFWMLDGNPECEILGPDPAKDLMPDDLTATDWEAI